MREFTKALFSYSLSLSLFGVKQTANLFTPAERDEAWSPATKAFDAVTNATSAQFGGMLNSAFHTLDNLQRGLVNLVFSFMPFPEGDGSRDASSEPVRWTDVMP